MIYKLFLLFLIAKSISPFFNISGGKILITFSAALIVNNLLSNNFLIKLIDLYIIVNQLKVLSSNIFDNIWIFQMYFFWFLIENILKFF